MAVLWSGTMANGNPNRFAAKHLHIVNASYNLDRMKQEGLRILHERNSFVPVLNKNATYGTIRPKANTLVVTNDGGLSAMEAWVEMHVHATGHYSIPVGVGVIVQNNYEDMTVMNVFNDDAKVGGSIDVSIDVTAGIKRVFHMRGIDDQGDDLLDFKMSRGGVSFTIPA